MKKTLLFALPFVLLSKGCTSCGEKSGAAQDLDKTLPAATCMVVNMILLKTTDRDGKTVYIDRNAELAYVAKNAKSPFIVTGTGCLLDDQYVGTVSHINPKQFDQEQITELIDLSLEKGDTAFLFNLRRLFLSHGLPDINEHNWQYYRVVSWVVLPQTLTIPIQRSFEQDPWRTPDDAYEVELQIDDDQNDLAIYKFSKKKPPLTGFSLDHLATDAEIKAIENGTDVVTWGYPVNVKRIEDQFISPDPDTKSIITGLPSSAVRVFQTDIDAKPGSSGSFVIQNNKVICVVKAVDANDNTICVPANYLRELLEQVKKASSTTSEAEK